MSAFDFPPTPTLNDIYTANGVTYICTAINPSVWKKLGSDTSVGSTNIAILKDQKNANVSSGAGAATTWIDRDITVKNDPQSFVTLNAISGGESNASSATRRSGTNGISYFALAAGTYKIKFRATGYYVSQHQAAMVYSSTESNINKVYATTDTVNKIYGTSETSINSSTSSDSTGSEVITFNQTTYFKVIHYITSTFSTSDFGQSSSPDKNVYLTIEIEDLATAVKNSSEIKPCAQLYEVDNFDFETNKNSSPIPFVHQHISQGGMTVNTSKSRITVPTTGVYLVNAMVAAENLPGDNAADGVVFGLMRNGTVYPESTQETGASNPMKKSHAYPINTTGYSSGVETFWSFSIYVSLNANDYLELAFADIDYDYGDDKIVRGSFGVHLI